MIRVFFRYDDFSQLSAIDVDRGVIDAFARHRVTCTFAVIPAVTAGSFRDPAASDVRKLAGEKLALLRDAVASGAVDVALHGLHHRTEYSQPPHSEFAGVAAARQLARIREGKRALEQSLGARVTAFVPPWNTYDEHTLAALRETGLRGISANRHAALVPDPEIRYLPITIELHELRAAVEAARRSSDAEAVVGVLMHPYDFRESGDERGAASIADLARELEWLRAQPDVRIVPVSELLASERFDAERFAANRPSVLETLFPPGVRRTSDVPLYLSARHARILKRGRTALTLSVLAALVALGFLASFALQQTAADAALNAGIGWVRYAVAAPLAALLVRAFLARRIYFRSMAAVAVLAGMLSALGVAAG